MPRRSESGCAMTRRKSPRWDRIETALAVLWFAAMFATAVVLWWAFLTDRI
jgi:hypothetical protein